MHLLRFTLLACAVTFSAAAFADTPKKGTPPTSSSDTPKKTNPPPVKKGGTSDTPKKDSTPPATK